ncbi:unnamed protein product [Polarella glacialis]|uniref:Thioredoxin domain-containing protein n=1 Tax=Polarella glacialis TaxID=89957 RepID=A0A813K2C8_POLGL|nr:unnamed protein product [Polarella glacialis]
MSKASMQCVSSARKSSSNLLACLILLVWLPLSLGKVKVGKHVVKLTEESFNDLFGTNDRPDILVKFYAPWCHACQSFAPVYSQAAQVVKERNLPVKLAALDTDQAKGLAAKLRIQSYPTLFFFPSDNKTMKSMAGIPRSAAAIVEWLEMMSGPAVRKLGSLAELVHPAPGDKAQVVLTGLKQPEAFASTADSLRLVSNWFWLEQAPSTGEAGITEIRHAGEPTLTFKWKVLDADDLDEDSELFSTFMKKGLVPLLMPASNPAKLMQELEEGAVQADGVIWVLLNSSAAGSELPEVGSCGSTATATEGEETCSAPGKATDSDPAAALEEAVRPHRAMLLEAAVELSVRRQADDGEDSKKKKNSVKSYKMIYVDQHRWSKWVEKELYAWDYPHIVVQRFAGGPRHFFSDDRRMPSNASELIQFVKDTVLHTPRQRTQRPEESEAGGPLKKLVGFTMEAELRSVPATVIYTMKGADDLSTEDDIVQQEDDMEGLQRLAAWLQKVCLVPPLVAVIDVRRNEVPLSLYSSASISTLTAPNVYFVPSDVDNNNKKNRFGNGWGAAISTYIPERLKDGLQRDNRVISKDLSGIANWVLELSRNISGLKVPADDVKMDDIDSSPGVVDLTAASLKAIVDSKSSGLVEFFSPDCYACKKFAPVYESAARTLHRDYAEANLTFGSIDCSSPEGQSLCAKYKVDAYPTIYFLKGGEFLAYGGGSKKKDLIQWLKRELTPTMSEVSSEAEALKAIAAASTPAMFWRGGRAAADARFALVLQTAKELKHKAGFFALEEDLGQQSLADNQVLSLLWPNGKREHFDPAEFGSAEFDPDVMQLWLAEATTKSQREPAEQPGPVHIVVGKTFRKALFETGGKHVILEVYAPWCKHCKELAPIYEEFAKKMHEENYNILVAKMDGEANGIPFEGFSYKGFPTVFYLSPESITPIKVSERTLSGLVSFARKRVGRSAPAPGQQASATVPTQPASGGFMEGLLEKFKSEDLPSQQTSPVLTVVLRNIFDVVFSDTRDCVLMVYAPGCPYCKAAMPRLEKFAIASTKDGKDIIAAKMDGEKNDLPMNNFEYKGYPTIFFVQRGKKEPSRTWVGDGSVQQMERYLEAL